MNRECEEQPTSVSWYDVAGFEHCPVFISLSVTGIVMILSYGSLKSNLSRISSSMTKGTLGQLDDLTVEGGDFPMFCWNNAFTRRTKGVMSRTPPSSCAGVSFERATCLMDFWKQPLLDWFGANPKKIEHEERCAGWAPKIVKLKYKWFD